jgi:hypothetical protein
MMTKKLKSRTSAQKSESKESPDEKASESLQRARLSELHDKGKEIWKRFDKDVRRQEWHPFVPADYQLVERSLLRFQRPGLRFLEWGSATGVITIMADMLGYEARGIEIDPALVEIARGLAQEFDSAAQFAVGSFLPAGYEWVSEEGDRRYGTIGRGESAYAALGSDLDSFDLVFAYPWSGEEPIMHDVIRRHGGDSTHFLLYGASGVQVYQGGQRLS